MIALADGAAYTATDSTDQEVTLMGEVSATAARPAVRDPHGRP